MKKLSIAIDMDDTIVETTEKLVQVCREHLELEVTIDSLMGKGFHQVLSDEHFSTLHEFLNQPGFFRDLPMKNDALEVIQALNEKYHVFIATAAMEFPNSFTAKYDWLREYLPFISPMNFIFCGHKYMLGNDILIDDSPTHISAYPGRGLMFTAPHNTQFDQFERVDSWQQVAQKLL